MDIYQVKIILKDTRPKVWRRVLVPSDLLLSNLHKIIQTTMGWDNMHLHQFINDDLFYTVIFEEIEWSEFSNIVDYNGLRICDLLTAEKEKMIYEYDFGDGWMHEIRLEKILPDDGEKKVPLCTGGEMNCPPEDCGGVWGYASLKQILKDPTHEAYEEWMEWLEEDYDPEHFNRDEVNQMLKQDNYGCNGWF